MGFIFVTGFVLMNFTAFGFWTSGEKVWKHPPATHCVATLAYSVPLKGFARLRSLFSPRPPEQATFGSSEQVALLRTIAARPNDLTARLVYADWIQEHGEGAFAEFIRLQIGLSSGFTFWQQISTNPTPEYTEVFNRAKSLLHENEARWIPRQLAGAGEYLWKNGFIEEVIISQKDLIRYGDRLAIGLPALRKITLTNYRPFGIPPGPPPARVQQAAFLHIPDSLRELTLRDEGTLNNFLRLGEHRQSEANNRLRNLELLELDFKTALDTNALNDFFQAVSLPKLRTLVINVPYVYPEPVSRALRQIPHSFPRLKSLKVSEWSDGLTRPVDNATLTAWGRPIGFRLEELDISGALAEAADFSIIAREPGYEYLRRLNLSNNRGVSTEQLRAFLRSPYITPPFIFEHSFDLFRNPVDRKVLEAFQNRFGVDRLMNRVLAQ